MAPPLTLKRIMYLSSKKTISYLAVFALSISSFSAQAVTSKSILDAYIKAGLLYPAGKNAYGGPEKYRLCAAQNIPVKQCQ